MAIRIGASRPRAAVFGVVLSVAALLGGGCSRSANPARGGDGRYLVVTTVGMITDVATVIAGPRAQVVGLMGAGVDPHLYRPTRNDIALLQRADIVFYNGLLLEGRMIDALVQLARDKPVVAVTAQIDPERLLEPSGGQGHADPHVWMDASLWGEAVNAVAAGLARHDPPHAEEYRERATQYAAELAELDVYVRTVIASIPEPQRELITAHDAFSYFGRAYGIRVHGIQGISTESEAGLNDINQLVNLIVGQRIGAVFVESSVADKNVRALLEGAAARGHTLRIGGTLYSDAMGAAGAYEGTYLGMLDHNATTIARALGGQAPEGGWRGRLTGSAGAP